MRVRHLSTRQVPRSVRIGTRKGGAEMAASTSIAWNSAMGRREGRREMIAEVVDMWEEAQTTAEAEVLRKVLDRLRAKADQLLRADCVE